MNITAIHLLQEKARVNCPQRFLLKYTIALHYRLTYSRHKGNAAVEAFRNEIYHHFLLIQWLYPAVKDVLMRASD